MRLLLDTHTLIWWLTEDSTLPVSARKLIASRNSAVLVSAISAWEIATGGWRWLPIWLGISGGYLARESIACWLAQAQIESLVIVSNDALLGGYGVNRVW
jgi:PIN domain nuclease of toxin-antitoxin system